jgi:hypothetical protein
MQWIRRIATGYGDYDMLNGIALDGGGTIYVGGNVCGDAFIAAMASYPATPGDANLDGCVDGLDYTIWSNNYQESDKWWQGGDFTGEGYVDGLDYVAWSNNYLAGCPAAVPEPGSPALLALGACALARRCTRRRS